MDIESLRKIIIDRIDMTREIEEEEFRKIIDEVIEENSDVKKISVSKRLDLHNKLFNSIRGLGVIEDYVRDDSVTEIMVNGPDNIFIEKNGRIVKVKEKFSDKHRLEDVISQIVGKTNKRVNESEPIVDTRLENGSRVNVVMPPIALDGAALTIRKFPKKAVTMEDLIDLDSLTKPVAEFLEKCVKSRLNIFISGGTSSGKTTFLNALSNYIPRNERIITIEDSAELRLSNIDNLIRMETRPPNLEGKNEVTIRDLIKSSLRMRPDRIIVGEVRGEEVIDMLGAAMNTGHDGSMSTGHANSAKDMMSRLETMILMGMDIPLAAIRSQIASALDMVIHLARLRDKTRRVVEIDEVRGVENGEIILAPIFKFVEDETKVDGKIKGELVRCGKLVNREKILNNGLDFQ